MVVTTPLEKRKVLQRMMTSEDWDESGPLIYDQLKRLGEALSDETRIKVILELIRSNYLSVAKLGEKLKDVETKTLYYHYNILKDSRLIYWSEKGIGKKLKRGNLVYPSDYAIVLIHDVLVPHPAYAMWKSRPIPSPEVETTYTRMWTGEQKESDFDHELSIHTPIMKKMLDQEPLSKNVLEKIGLIFLDEEVQDSLHELYETFETIPLIFPRTSEKGRTWEWIKRTCPGDSDEEVIFYVFRKFLSSIDVSRNERLVSQLRSLQNLRTRLKDWRWNQAHINDLYERLSTTATNVADETTAKRRSKIHKLITSIDGVRKEFIDAIEKRSQIEKEIDSIRREDERIRKKLYPIRGIQMEKSWGLYGPQMRMGTIDEVEFEKTIIRDRIPKEKEHEIKELLRKREELSRKEEPLAKRVEEFWEKFWQYEWSYKSELYELTSELINIIGEELGEAIKVDPYGSKYPESFSIKEFLKEKRDERAELVLKEGLDLLNEERCAEAIDRFEKALFLNPDLDKAIGYKSLALFKLDEPELSLKYVNKALNNRPDAVGLLLLKQAILVKLDKLDKALECSKDALEIDPLSDQVWYSKACIESLIGKVDYALLSLRKAIELNSKYIEMARKDKDFRNLRRHAKERFERLLNNPTSLPEYIT